VIQWNLWDGDFICILECHCSWKPEGRSKCN